MSMSYLLSLPAGTGAFLFAGAIVLATWLAYFFIRPFLRVFVRSQTHANELIGQALSVFAVLFGLLLGMLSISTYQSAAEVERHVLDEGANILALYHNASAYEEPFRSELKSTLREYVTYVIDDAWPLQQQGKLPQEGGARMKKIFDVIFGFSPETKVQENLQTDTVGLFAKMRDARYHRLGGLVGRIPDLMWALVWIGAISVLTLILLLDMKFALHILLSGFVAFFLGVVIYLLIALDNPFRGEVGVSADVFREVLSTMKRVEGS